MGRIADLRQVPVNQLKPYQANAKIHGKEQVEKLKASIKEFGFLSPCLIDRENNIIAGHGRVEAAKALGMDEVPCLYLEDLTEEQRRAYILADNKLTELGEWDRDILSAELAALRDEGFNIELTGFSIDDIIIEEIDFTEVDDAWEEAAADAEAEPKAKPGDIYQLGRHRLMCGDATSAEDVKKLLDGAAVQLVITDPPYNVDYAGKNKLLNLIDKGNRVQKDIENDKKSDKEFLEFLTKAFKNMAEALQPGGVFYIWHADTNRAAFLEASAAAGLEIRQILIWVKNMFVLGRQDYQWIHEPCLYGWKDGAAHYFTDSRSLTTVANSKADIEKLSKEDLKKILTEVFELTSVINEDKPMVSDLHPTMKPINLFKRHIENSSSPGDIVMDLFGGSGTALIAAEQTERTCYMLEYSPAYVDTIIERWETFTGQKAKKIKA